MTPDFFHSVMSDEFLVTFDFGRYRADTSFALTRPVAGALLINQCMHQSEEISLSSDPCLALGPAGHRDFSPSWWLSLVDV